MPDLKREPGSGAAIIDPTPPRALFAELVAGAIQQTRVEPTPMATAYLVELLASRVPRAAPAREPEPAEETLAAGLLRARLERGAARLRRLRGLGDRALFLAGFFGDSVVERPAGLGYHRDAGRLAYSDVSSALSARLSEHTWARLFEELADRFGDYVEVLTEVGDVTRARSPQGALALQARYLRSLSTRDRRRLARRGLAVPIPAPLRPQ